jgi:hypothetical protein
LQNDHPYKLFLSRWRKWAIFFAEKRLKFWNFTHFNGIYNFYFSSNFDNSYFLWIDCDKGIR